MQPHCCGVVLTHWAVIPCFLLTAAFCLWICLLGAVHVSGPYIHYVFFCVWLLLLSIMFTHFIHVVTRISTSFLCKVITFKGALGTSRLGAISGSWDSHIFYLEAGRGALPHKGSPCSPGHFPFPEQPATPGKLFLHCGEHWAPGLQLAEQTPVPALGFPLAPGSSRLQRSSPDTFLSQTLLSHPPLSAAFWLLNWTFFMISEYSICCLNILSTNEDMKSPIWT